MHLFLLNYFKRIMNAGRSAAIIHTYSVNNERRQLMQQINRAQYRELDMLLWDMHEQYVAPQVAFEVYERRWAFIDPDNIKENEQALIDQLVELFGNGCFMPAVH